MFPHRSRVLAIALLCGLIAVAAHAVFAQVPTIKGKGKFKSEVHLTSIFPVPVTTAIDIYTVPDGRTLVITDVMASNMDASQGSWFRLREGGLTQVGTIAVPAATTFDHTFATGLEFSEGSTVEFWNGGSATLFFSIHGYLRKD